MSAWGQEWTRHGEGPGIPHRWPNDPERPQTSAPGGRDLTCLLLHLCPCAGRRTVGPQQADWQEWTGCWAFIRTLGSLLED